MMKDKLYKTNRKASFYRLRNAFITIVFLAVGAAVITLPYRYVSEAINAYQEKKEAESSETLVSENEIVDDETN